MNRRHSTGLKTLTPKNIFVVHQNHDEAKGKFKPTERSFKNLCDDVKKQYDKKVNYLKDMEM